MIKHEREGEFLEWLHKMLMVRFDFDDPAGPVRPAISVMREAGGVDYRQADVQTVAFQVEFETVERARNWSRGEFADLADSFSEIFGEDSHVFVSMFERVTF